MKTELTKDNIILISITFIGAVLRFWDLGVNPLWVDESLFAYWSTESMFVQEYPAIILANLFGFQSEFWLRFMFALAGTLTIPAIYLVVKNHKLEAAIIVAIFPLFIFWSRMARPYAFAGLFLVLGWRWWYFSFVSILTTPFAFLGVKIWKQKYWIIGILLITALIVYFNRPDAGAGKNIFIYRTRLLYLPLLVLLLYITERNWNFRIIKGLNFKLVLFIGIILTSLAFLPAHKYNQWYSHEVRFSDWRNAGYFEFATNAHVSHWYGGSPCYEFLPRHIPLFNKMIEKGYTVRLGLDLYALEEDYSKSLPKEILDKYRDYLLAGNILRLAINKKEIKIY